MAKATHVRLEAPLPSDLLVAIHESAPASPTTWGGDPYWRERRTWRFSLSRHGKTEGPFYWTGAAGQIEAPTPEDVMLSLALDATCYLDADGSVAGWMRNFGGDPGDEADVAKAKAIMGACAQVASAFTRLGLDPRAPCFQEA